jgi:hypothetical protein
MTYTHSTHMITYDNAASELAIVCGNYCRRLRKFIFSGDVVLTPWERIPTFRGAELTPCIKPIIESEGAGMLNSCDNIG